MSCPDVKQLLPSAAKKALIEYAAEFYRSVVEVNEGYFLTSIIRDCWLLGTRRYYNETTKSEETAARR